MVGGNGAGKSTIVKMLLGLYSPSTGTISVDGINFEEIAHESLRNCISATFQDYYNFEFTVAESIALGRAHISDKSAENMELIIEAAKKGGANDFINALPDAYSTPIGYELDGGQGLSGGQWQRIAVSRTFMSEPLLFVLDEPTAALDPQGEADMYEQFIAVQNRAVLLISHRLGSARLADRILLLKNGSIIEDGTHDELLKAGGEYAQMWEAQSQWYK